LVYSRKQVNGKTLYEGEKMKFLWMIPCLALCACMNNNRANEGYSDYGAPYNEPVVVPQQQMSTNPYALEPPAYEQSVNLALSEKEQELFQKEKNLIDAQQELYEREKKLADREAAFIGRSKALDYKERNISEGRYYAPVAAASRPASVAVEYVPTPIVAPVPVAPVEHVPAPQARVYYAQPVMPAPQVNVPSLPVAPAPVEENFKEYEEVLSFNASSEPASYEPVDAGFIILQHPIQRDLVRCPAADDVCLQSYERLGYVRANNLSRFTAQDELNTAGTYPTNTAGQWRENNSIPRW